MKTNELLNTARIEQGLDFRDIAKQMYQTKPSDVKDYLINNGEMSDIKIKEIGRILGVEPWELEKQASFNLKAVNTHEIKHASFKNTKSVSKPPETKKIDKDKILKEPEDKICRFCDTKTETGAFRHSENPEIKAIAGGKGTGKKIPDIFSVYGCMTCDSKYSPPLDKNASELERLRHEVAWWRGIAKTNLV
jgi:hypothetical protein